MNLDTTNESFECLQNANNKSEWLWRIYLKFAMGGYIISNFMMSAVSVWYSWFANGTLDIRHLYKPFKLVYVGN